MATAVPTGPPAADGLTEVCHSTDGAVGNFTIWVNESAVAGHVAHGDSLGACGDDEGPGDTGNETDGDKGHGNDPGGCDEDNPGLGGPPDCGDGNETGDGDKGHGNDPDGCDEDNPGQGGPPDCGDDGPGDDTNAPAGCDAEADANDVASIRVEWSDGSAVGDESLVKGTTYRFFACAYDADGNRTGWVNATWTIVNATLGFDPAWLSPTQGNYTDFKPIIIGATGQIKATFNPFDLTGLLTVVSPASAGGGGGGGGGSPGSNGGPGGDGTPGPPFVPPSGGSDFGRDFAPPIIPSPQSLPGLMLPFSLGLATLLMAGYGVNRGALPLLQVRHALPHHMRRVRLEALEPETGEVLASVRMTEYEREDGLILWQGELAGRRQGTFRLQVAADATDAFRVDDLGLMALHDNEIEFYQVGHEPEPPEAGPPMEPPRPPVAPAPSYVNAPTTENAIVSLLAEAHTS